MENFEQNPSRKRTAPEQHLQMRGDSEVSSTDPNSVEYIMKRQRNNAAVNKTRQKKRKEEIETSKRVQELREENARLERQLESARRELNLLKEMVVACATGKAKN